ncbi:YsnF/AvaK domain-containing protein [Aerophototrophica crusticola]|uniref:YsnF/AvaK domain-containing protein n=1 Tax=Aerophototrophica crusticola TaxID=1709002 RepID=A0A858R3N2_9PROT|nr:YsnF/AvaK domain-containing protein [Rhodospirillaceae bacterium B3]
MTDKTILALYDDFANARRALERLHAENVSQQEISVIAADRDEAVSKQLVTAGASSGGSGILGGLLGGAKPRPVGGLGSVMASGPIAAGAHGPGGIVQSLVKAGVPNDDAHAYAEGIRRGGSLVSVHAHDADAARIISILQAEGPVDIDHRRSTYMSSGWSRFDENAGPYTGPVGEARVGSGLTGAAGALRDTDRTTTTGSTTSRTTATGEEHIPVVEESLAVGKRAVERGQVRIHSRVVETPVEETVNLRDESVHVERRTVSDASGVVPEDAFRERTVEFTETDEEAVVSKQARLTGEVVVSKDVETREEVVRDTVRKTEVEVEGDPATRAKSTTTSTSTTKKA